MIAGIWDPRQAIRLLACLSFGVVAMCAADASTAVADTIDEQERAADLSFLNKDERPAGRHGFVHARDDRLVFDDGQVARFWGTNVTAQALFGSDKASVKEHAARLSRLGFNLVRLHHHDSYWTSPNVFGDGSSGSTRRLDPSMLEKIDWWLKCLKSEGIYVWLDLHVQRRLRPADGISDFEEIAKGGTDADLKGFNYVDDDIEAAMKAFNEAYLSHLNPYTGLAYKDDAAIAVVLITNENDLTEHYGNALLPNQRVPRHNARYMALARDFARVHALDQERVWRSWEPGESKVFLNDLERGFNRRMMDHLRSIGVKVPIVTTNWWGGQASSLPALSSGDMIDVHAYEEAGAIERDPRKAGGALHKIAMAQVAGMPLSVSEWNVSAFPSAERMEQPLLMADMADRQGWDAILHYAYAQTPLQFAAKPSNWHALNDPSRLAMLPAAALVYRQQHVRQSRMTYAWTPSSAELFGSPRANTEAALRIAAERGRLVTVLPKVAALPWLKAAPPPAGAVQLATAMVLPAEAALVSDTRESRRDWDAGTFSIDTPRTQAAAGRIGGGLIALSDVNMRFDNSRASVAVQALDDNSIAASGSILVSVATASVPSPQSQLPFLAEPASGVVEIRARPGLESPQRRGVKINYLNGRYVVHFEGKEAVHWISLRAPGVKP